MRDETVERIARFAPVLALVTLAATSTGVALASDRSPAADRAAAVARTGGNAGIEAIRRAMSRYEDIEIAREDGWSAELTPCMESEAGGMGYHYGRPALLEDGGALDPMTPEALLYVPQADGSMEFVAVEYILPFADWHGSEAPVFMDREMIPNEAFGLWTLHLWFADNPNGTFAGWNPNVDCAYAATQR